MKIAMLLLILALRAALGSAAPAFTDDHNKDGKPDQWYDVSDGRVTRLSMDRNYDGRIDYVVDYDGDGRKRREELDFNYDGVMDDFYYYESGKLLREEIDSNYDERVDIWVFLEGLYIHRYEMDTDFDGVVDFVQDYAAEARAD